MAKRRNILKGDEFDQGMVRAINEDLDALYKNISNENIKKGIDPSKLRHNKQAGIVLTTDETAIGHSLGMVPHCYQVIPKGTGNWYESKDPDSQNIYLKVSTGSMTVDVLIEG